MSGLSRRAMFAVLSFGLGAGCGRNDGSDGSDATLISVEELSDQLAAGPAFVDVRLAGETLAADEVRIEDVEGDEKITSEVASVDAGSGTLTLALGGLVVDYGKAARFRMADGESVTRLQWESSVASGTAVELRRDTPKIPQPPDVAGFEADDLRIAMGIDARRIEVLVDKDNLLLANDTEATLRVFGLDIAIDARTSLQDHSGPDAGTVPERTPKTHEVEFEGFVVAVAPLDGTLTLADGTLVDVKGAEFDPLGDLHSLAAVNDALLRDQVVRAEGRGEAATDGMIVASAVKIEVDDGSPESATIEG